MKRQTRYLIFGIVSCIFTVVAIVIIKMAASLDEPGYQIYQTPYTLDNGYCFTSIQVCEMKDKELEKKINESLNSCFYILVSPWFEEGATIEREPVIHLQSKKYLSIEYIFYYSPSEIEYWHLCVTVDIESGEVVYFDDLIELDESFALLVQNGAVLNCNEVTGYYTAEEATEQENTYYSKRKVSSILYFFSMFTREKLYGDHYWKDGYKMDVFATYLYNNIFYLEEGKICFTRANMTNGFCIAWIMTEDIEEHLKVPKW